MVLQNYYTSLSSNRLFFRKLTYDDIDNWMAFYDNNPNLKYLGIDLNRTNYEMAEAWIQAQLERYQKNEFGQLAAISKDTGELIGTRGMSFITPQSPANPKGNTYLRQQRHKVIPWMILVAHQAKLPDRLYI